MQLLADHLPLTLNAAWSVTSRWKTANLKISGGSDTQSVFILADEVTVPQKHAAGRGSKQAKRGAGRDQKQLHTGADQTSKPSSTKAMSETGTCKGCLVIGHLYRNCPDNSDSVKDSEVLLATGEDDSADDNVYDSTVYLIEGKNTDECIYLSPARVKNRDFAMFLWQFLAFLRENVTFLYPFLTL